MDIWDVLIEGMPIEPKKNCDFWSDGGNEIFCRTEEQANALADMFDKLFQGNKATTGHYDDSDGFTDKFSGWYYVTI